MTYPVPPSSPLVSLTCRRRCSCRRSLACPASCLSIQHSNRVGHRHHPGPSFQCRFASLRSQPGILASTQNRLHGPATAHDGPFWHRSPYAAYPMEKATRVPLQRFPPALTTVDARFYGRPCVTSRDTSRCNDGRGPTRGAGIPERCP